MPTLILDTVNEQELDLSWLKAVRIRTGYIKDIDVSGEPDPIVLEKALAVSGFPAFLSSYSTLYPLMRLSRVVLKPVGYRILRVYLYYESPDYSTAGGSFSYIIRDRTSVVSVESNTIPGTRAPIKVNYFDQDTIADSTIVCPPDLITMPFMRPMRQVSVYMVAYGIPPVGFQNAVGFVNDGLWLGYPKGYWMLSEFRSDISKYQSSYEVEAVATSRVFEDWSNTGIMINKLTGRYVEVFDEDVSDMNALPYSYGMIYNTDGMGMVRVGGYPVCNFSTIFNFS